jgi:PAS domain S-box-containing protein
MDKALRLLEGFRDAAIVANGAVKVVYANAAARALFADPDRELVGAPLKSLPGLVDYPNLFRQSKQELKGRQRWEAPDFSVGRTRTSTDIVVERLANYFAVESGTLWRFIDKKGQRPVPKMWTESAEMYRDLTELASDGICIVQDAVVRFANPQLCQMLDLPIEELVGSDFLDHIDPTAAGPLIELYYRHLQGERSLGIVESRVKRKDGAALDVEIDAGIIPFEGRDATLVTLHNVSDRKQAEAAMHYRNELLALLADIAGRFVAVDFADFDAQIREALAVIGKFFAVDRCAVYLFLNAGDRKDVLIEWLAPDIRPVNLRRPGRYLDAFPWAAEKLGGFQPVIFNDANVAPPEAAVEQRIWKSLGVRAGAIMPLIGGEKLVGMLSLAVLGRTRTWTAETVTTLKNIAAVLSSAVERRRVDQALRESEERYRRVTENVQDIIWSYDLTTRRFQYVSQAAERLLGYPPEKAGSMTLSDIFPPDALKKVTAALDGLLGDWPTTGKVIIEAEHKRADGTLVPLEVIGSPIADAAGRPVQITGTSRDVTERKLAERALARRYELLKIITETATRFIAVTPAELDAAIEEALGAVGRFVEAQRGVVYLFREGGEIADNTHEWRAPGLPAAKESQQNLVAGKNPWLQRHVTNLEPLRVPNVDKMPSEAAPEAAAWRALGIKAAVGVPLGRHGAAIGLLGLIDTRGPHEWDDETIALLQNIAAIFVNALERTRAEQALRESEEQYRMLIDLLPEMVALHDGEVIQFINEAGWRLLGGDRADDVIGRTVREFFHPDSHRVLVQRMRDLANGDAAAPFVEVKYQQLHGGVVDVEAASVPLVRHGRRAILSIARDITERKQAAATLAYRIELLKLITDIATSFIYLEPNAIDAGIEKALEIAARFAEADHGFVTLFRLDSRFADCAHEWSAPGLKSQKDFSRNLARFPWLAAQISERRPVLIHDIREIPPEAKLEKTLIEAAGVASVAVAPMVFQGRTVGYVGFINTTQPRHWDEETVALLQNIAAIFVNAWERARAERALLQSEQTSRALLDGADDLALLTDRTGRIVAVNGVVARTLNVPPESLIGKDGVGLLAHSAREYAREVIARMCGAGRSIREERQFADRWFLVSVNPAVDDRSQVSRLAVYARDITDLKAREDELRRALRQAQEAELLKTRFLANMSHEIRTPLNHVIGITSILLMQPDLAVAERTGYLKIVKRGGESMLHLLTAILDLSKIESGKLEPTCRPFAFRDWLEELRERCTAQANIRRLHFSFTLDRRFPERLSGDRGMLEQVLNNLLENAFKFTKKGQVDLQVDLVNENDDQVEASFRVTDTGVGIAAEHLNKVFESFFQVDNSSTREFAGAGLGLTIARETARLVGGDITVASDIGRGSSFRFVCPLRRDASPGPSPAPKS